MRHQIPFGFGTVIALVVALAGGGGVGRAQAPGTASAGGRGGRRVVTLKPDRGSIAAIPLSSDGSLVFFILAGGNEPELADGTQLPRGLYVINADGSSPPHRIVGIPEIAGLL